MSKGLSEEITVPLKSLITTISGFEEGTEPFNHVMKYFTLKLKKADTMYFLNKRDVDQNINSMSEKFCFHGFFHQAEALNSAYKIYIPELLPKPETMYRLNMVKFMLCMSDSPTKHFVEHPEIVVEKRVEVEQKVDWAAYLNEGVEKWNPNYDESSDDDSYNSLDNENSKELMSTNLSECLLPGQIRSSEKMCIMDFHVNREELLATIQHTWYNQDRFLNEPESKWREANIGILWENYLKEQVQGLILLKSPSIISEYKVIREILWQLWCLHTSKTLELSGNSIRPRPDVTLASVRAYAFYTFMGEFVPYMEVLDYFRDFERSLQTDIAQNEHTICYTYQSYCNCLTSIISPIYKKLSELENEVRQQETTYTLLKLADELRTLFHPIKILKEIHDEVVLDPNSNSPLKCATTLITGLKESLNFTVNRLEQDLKLTLFLGSVYHYLGIIDTWLMKDDLADYTGEFVIEKKIIDRWHIQFSVREDLDENCKNDAFLKIFMEKILEIGRNINLLRLLGKYDMIGDCREPIYDEFLRDVFNKLDKFKHCGDPKEHSKEKPVGENLDKAISERDFIFPVIGTEICKSNPDMQKLENLVDVEDGFLVTAFADFFLKKPELEPTENNGLYNRISTCPMNLFPKANFFESILLNIIERRFTVSGLMVKNLLIEDHLLEKQFQFLKHMYLFFDDMICPFYRRLFEKSETSNRNWANDIWLTSHLHDIFMDMYPEFYEKCSVQMMEGWSLCTDSLSACSLINVNVEITWPLNIIIKQEQMELYKEIFQFLLKLKWAMYTVNHLMFSDLESQYKSTKKSRKTFKGTDQKNKITAKLIRLKFCLINILNSLQHFVFGFVFAKNFLNFELDFEKAYDLNSLIESHSDFITSVSGTILDLKQIMLEKDKNNNVLNCVKLLKVMWNDLRYATAERLSDCNKMYDMFFSDICPIIFPVYIYDY